MAPFCAYGLALAAALATAWAVREHVGQGEPSRRPTRPLSNDWSRPRTWRRARGWTNRTCSDGRFRGLGARASLDPLAAQALLGAVLSADIDAGEIILPAHLLGQPAGQASTAPAAQLALPAGMRALNVTVADLGPLAGCARGRQRRRLRILCPRRQAQRRSGAVGGPSLSVGAPADDGAPDTANAMLAVRPEDALRFVARQGGILTAMLRHRDDAVAVGDEDQADPAALQGMPAESLRRGGVVISTETWLDGGRRAVRATDTASGQTGCDMALNRYRLAAMLGLCGCLAGVQAQTILVELEVGKAGCCPTRACGAWRSATGIARGRRRRAGIVIFGRAEGESSVHV